MGKLLFQTPQTRPVTGESDFIAGIEDDLTCYADLFVGEGDLFAGKEDALMQALL